MPDAAVTPAAPVAPPPAAPPAAAAPIAVTPAAPAATATVAPPYVPASMPVAPVAAPPAKSAEVTPNKGADAATPPAAESVLAPKPAEPAKVEPSPAPIEIKLPEGAKFDEKLLGEAKSIMADGKTSPSQKLQALIDMQAKAGAANEKALNEQMQRGRVSDLESLKGDPKYGGAFFDKTRSDARSILEKTQYGPAVSKKLEMYGIDCDPDFTKFLAEIRSFIAEDSTGSRLISAAPEVVVPQRPMTQTERVAATYKANQPKK